MVGERIGKYLEGSGYNIIEVLFKQSHCRTEEYHERPQNT
jgi:hypothetical protein